MAPALARAADRGGRRKHSRDLEAALRRSVEGEVRFDVGSLTLYATDLSIYRHVPIGVVVPRHAGDVIATVAACRERNVPLLGRGCGTSLAGQTCNVAVVIDFSKYMNRLLGLDPHARRARIEPGLNNSCGAPTVMGGKTVDNVEELDIITYDGLQMRVGATSDEEFARIEREGGRRAEIYQRLKRIATHYGEEIHRRYPDIPRRVSGYNLDDLLPEKGFHVAACAPRTGDSLGRYLLGSFSSGDPEGRGHRPRGRGLSRHRAAGPAVLRAPAV